MERAKFLYVEVKVYPASIIMEPYSDRPDWETLIIAKEPVLSTFENVGAFEGDGCSDLYKAIKVWIEKEMLEKGKELFLQDCPKAPEA